MDSNGLAPQGSPKTYSLEVLKWRCRCKISKTLLTSNTAHRLTSLEENEIKLPLSGKSADLIHLLHADCHETQIAPFGIFEEIQPIGNVESCHLSRERYG